MVKRKRMNHHYLLEPVLSSELILINNAKLLQDKPELYNNNSIDRINILRDQFIDLDQRAEQGESGLQKQKRICRDELRDLSSETFVDRDTELFGKMITTMADKIVTRPQFSGYTFKEEMKSLAIEHILKYTWKFDPYKQSELSGQYISAFAYISTIIFNACIATINKFTLEQKKAKEDFQELQKLVHRDPNCSTIGPDFEEVNRSINLPNLEQNSLLSMIKSITITDATEFWIPQEYKITEKELDFILKYSHNISIRRIKVPREDD